MRLRRRSSFGAAVALARVGQAAGAAIALCTLVGWELDLPHLKSVVPGLIAMNPLTALCFLLVVASLALGTCRLHAALRVVQAGCAAVVALSGLWCLGAYVLGRPAIVDQWLFSAQLQAASAPSRMVPSTAFNFVCIGIAAMLLAGRRVGDVRVAQALAGVAMVIASVTLTGYVYDVSSLIGVVAMLPMALHTALGFECVAIAVLFARPDQGPVSRVTSAGPGGRVVRRLVPAFLVLPFLFGWLRVHGERLGFYDGPFGVAMMVGATSVMGMVLVWFNANALTDHLQHAIFRSKRYGGLVAVLFLDLDGFKQVNDTQGHAGGDELLKSVAQRVAACIRPTDTAARLAGDEFTAVLTDLATPAAAEVVAQRILAALSRSHSIADRELTISRRGGAEHCEERRLRRVQPTARSRRTTVRRALDAARRRKHATNAPSWSTGGACPQFRLPPLARSISPQRSPRHRIPASRRPSRTTTRCSRRARAPQT